MLSSSLSFLVLNRRRDANFTILCVLPCSLLTVVTLPCHFFLTHQPRITDLLCDDPIFLFFNYTDSSSSLCVCVSLLYCCSSADYPNFYSLRFAVLHFCVPHPLSCTSKCHVCLFVLFVPIVFVSFCWFDSENFIYQYPIKTLCSPNPLIPFVLLTAIMISHFMIFVDPFLPCHWPFRYLIC